MPVTQTETAFGDRPGQRLELAQELAAVHARHVEIEEQQRGLEELRDAQPHQPPKPIAVRHPAICNR
jgi:hypothetical protein